MLRRLLTRKTTISGAATAEPSPAAAAAGSDEGRTRGGGGAPLGEATHDESDRGVEHDEGEGHRPPSAAAGGLSPWLNEHSHAHAGDDARGEMDGELDDVFGRPVPGAAEKVVGGDGHAPGLDDALDEVFGPAVPGGATEKLNVTDPPPPPMAELSTASTSVSKKVCQAACHCVSSLFFPAI